MANARIRAAIKTARQVLQGVQKFDFEIVTIGADDPDPEPPEFGRQWVIQYADDATAAVAEHEWKQSLMDIPE